MKVCIAEGVSIDVLHDAYLMFYDPYYYPQVLQSSTTHENVL